jgi:hypothetical protein
VSHLKELVKGIQYTDEERVALGKALANNMQRDAQGYAVALFDLEDIKRLAIYRRATRAGYYSDGMPGQEPDETWVVPAPAPTVAMPKVESGHCMGACCNKENTLL